MKKYISLLLITTLILSLFSLSIFGEEGVSTGNTVSQATGEGGSTENTVSQATGEGGSTENTVSQATGEGGSTENTVSQATGESESSQQTHNSESDISNKKTYKISYGKGLYITYNGKEPNNFIKGTPPASQSVIEGGSIVVASNTFTFRDYSFGGWKYTYTDASGNKKTKYYSSGETISNISKDMKLEATWLKKDKDLKIDAYLLYANSNEKSNHIIGEITILEKAPTAPSSDYTFCGWTDNDGTILYQPGDSYEIKYINTVIKPVWSANGQQINYRKISVDIKGMGASSISEIFILSGTKQKIEFTPNENYYISDVTVNGVSKGALSSIDITVENEDINIFVEFKKIEAILPTESDAPSDEHYINIIIESGKGSFSSQQSETVLWGKSYTVTFTPDENYSLPLSIKDNGNTVSFEKGWNGEYTIENVTENHTITIGFLSSDNLPSEYDENTSNPNKTNNKNMGFAPKFTVIVIIIGVAFGICCVIFVIKLQKNKNKNKKKKNSKKGNNSNSVSKDKK